MIRLPQILTVALTATAMGAVFALYNFFVDNPQVRREARSGYVLESQLLAARAREAEARRQREVTEAALTEHRDRVALLEAEQAAILARREQEITQNEQRRRAAGRACLLDDADIRWLRRN